MRFSLLQQPSFWTELTKDPSRAPLLTHIEKKWEELGEDPIPSISYFDRMLFYKTGDRKTFETSYFRRRNALSAVSILALIHPEREDYLANVQRYLWEICDEYSWALPAHTQGDPDTDPFELDLFNCETGFAVTEIAQLLRDRLEKAVCERVRIEVKRRIIEPYCARLTCFDDNFANWAAVCGGNVGGTLMYWDPALFRAQLPRILKNMQNFIDGFSDEGICMEGTTYWVYGFSNFVWFSEMLLHFTNGKIDLLDSRKVELIAGYMQRSFLKGNTTVSFSDGTRTGRAADELQYYLTQRFPNSVYMLPREVSATWDGNVSWIHWTRALLHTPPVDIPRSLPPKNYDFPMAAQTVVHEDAYSLFAKAGNNREEHNHNDVGSFILATKNGQVLCDIGAGIYTRQYFRHTMHERYAILCNSSLGHSVPIVNGQPQLFGKQYAGSLCHRGNRIEIEMAGAYGIPELQSLSRVLCHQADRVELTDSFEGEIDSFTDRFVSFFEPTVCENEVLVADVRIGFAPTAVTPRVSVDRHFRYTGDGDPVYLLDFEVKKGIHSVTFLFTF